MSWRPGSSTSPYGYGCVYAVDFVSEDPAQTGTMTGTKALKPPPRSVGQLGAGNQLGTGAAYLELLNQRT